MSSSILVIVTVLLCVVLLVKTIREFKSDKKNILRAEEDIRSRIATIKDSKK